MSKISRLSSFMTFLILLPLRGITQTVVPGGDVNGTWTLNGSPYSVEGNITLPLGDSLSIEPGVEIIFQGHYMFNVNGFLEASGTQSDSILFTAADPDTGWYGLRFVDAVDSSLLSFCIIEYGRATGIAPDNKGGGLYLDNSNPNLMSCTIRQNFSETAGGGIYCVNNSNPLISSCAIVNNTAILDGGGMNCWSGSAVNLDHCLIAGNSGNYGGGIFCGNSADMVVTNCTISGNTAGQYGGGLNSYNATPTLLNTIVEGNFGNGGVNTYNSGGISISYCNLYDNQGGNLTGNTIPAGAGQLTTLNANGDSCDTYFNILAESLFDDPGSGNYQITWLNFPSWDATRSPCIDAGNSGSQYNDPDATVSDIGAFYFDQSAHPPEPDIAVSSTSLDFGMVRIGLQGEVQLSVYNVGNRSLILTDVYTGSAVFETDFDPADSLIYPTDSLLIMVFFSPQDTISYGEILTIQNNDELIEVDLTGTGEPPPEPDIAVSTDHLVFGPVSVGSQLDLVITIYNVGDTTLVLYDVTTSDPVYTTDFIAADSLILPGDSLAVTITFTPNEITSYIDLLTISNSDEWIAVSLVGEGVSPPEPEIAVSTNSLQFGAVWLGNQLILPLIVYNTGDADLAIYEISTGNNAFTTDFDPADSLIIPGDSLVLAVSFTPSQVAVYDDTLTIDNNDETAYISLQGEGILMPEPVIAVSPDSLLFPSLLVGDQDSLFLTVYNIGDATLVLQGFSSSDSAFTTNFDPADSLIIPGDSLVLTVRFTPSQVAVYDDTLTIDNNDETVYVILQGEGILIPEPEIAVSPDSLLFPSLLVGDQDSLFLTVYNIGDTTLVLYNITLTDSAFSTNFNPDDSLVAPGDSLVMTIYFSPYRIAVYHDTIVVENNDTATQIFLEGEGMGPVQVNLTPYNPPITIPESGGSFDFNIAIENVDTTAHDFDIWMVIRLPEVGEVPTITATGLTLPVNTTIDRDRTQSVPEIAPPGIYTYFAYVGEYPWVVDDYDTFTFEKLGSGDGNDLGVLSDWLCSGESFEEFLKETGPEIPEKFTLYSPYPNPFNPATVLGYQLPDGSMVNLSIYNINGRLVAELVNGWRDAVVHEVTFDGTDLPSGVYFTRLTVSEFQQTRKLLLLK